MSDDKALRPSGPGAAPAGAASGSTAETPDDAATLVRARRGAGRVLARLVRLHTLGETSSLSAAELERLLGTMAYVLGVESLDDPRAVAVLSRDDAPEEYERLRASLARRAARLGDLWAEVARLMPPIPNKSLVETMASVARAPSRYDAYLDARRVPASLEYLPHGFVEAGGTRLEGVDAVELWLGCAREEAAWLARLPLGRVVSTLELHAPGYLDSCTSLRDLAEPYLGEWG